MVLVIAVLYHLRYALDCQYNANNTQISKDSCRDLVAMDCIRYEESIYCQSEMYVAYLAYLL